MSENEATITLEIPNADFSEVAPATYTSFIYSTMEFLYSAIRGSWDILFWVLSLIHSF